MSPRANHQSKRQPDVAGGSAIREYERRRHRRQERLRQRFGVAGAVAARFSDDPASTRAWAVGGSAEMFVAQQLERHLRCDPVALFHDRRIPGRGRSNIDHIAVTTGAVTVIDTKASRGTIALCSTGGILTPRRELLLVNGHDRSGQLDAILRQAESVQGALEDAELWGTEIRAALCYPYASGLPRFGQLRARDGTVAIDHPRGIARTARVAGAEPVDLDAIAAVIDRAFPRA